MRNTIDHTLEHVLFLARRFHKGDAYYVVTVILMELRIMPQYDGFDYLRKAILLCIEDPEQVMMKGLYQATAQQYTRLVLPEQIEQSIRSAVKKAWLNRDEAVWSCYFPHSIDGRPRKPANGEFISRLARIVELWEGCCQSYERKSSEEVII